MTRQMMITCGPREEQETMRHKWGPSFHLEQLVWKHLGETTGGKCQGWEAAAHSPSVLQGACWGPAPLTEAPPSAAFPACPPPGSARPRAALYSSLTLGHRLSFSYLLTASQHLSNQIANS